ncbi:MAG: hypothetical protein V3T14_12075 [Myxococcota bacterium]
MADRRARLALGALLFITVLAWGIAAGADPDMWWHLRAGADILEGSFPRVDRYSFTAYGQELVDHEWLSELLMIALYRVGGLETLNVAFGAAVAGTFLLVHLRLALVVHRYFAMSVALFAALGSFFVFGARPQILTLLFLSLTMWWVDRARSGEASGRSFWLFPPLFLVWANFHGGFVAGVGLLLLYALGDALDPRAEGSLSRSDSIRLASIAGLSSILSLANPQTYRLWVLPILEVSSDVNRRHILEWMPPDLASSSYAIFAGFLALAIFSFLLNRRRPALADGVLLAGTALAGLLSIRHVPLFMVLGVPVVGRQLWPAVRRIRIPRLLCAEVPAWQSRSVRVALIGGILMLGTLSAVGSFYARLSRIPSSVRGEYPVDAVRFLKSTGLDRARGLNEYKWGGYLIWNGVPVFIDGRANTLYGERFLERYFRAYAFEVAPDPLAEEFDVDYVLVRSEHHWAAYFAAHPNWQRVYRDETASVFLTRRLAPVDRDS